MLVKDKVCFKMFICSLFECYWEGESLINKISKLGFCWRICWKFFVKICSGKLSGYIFLHQELYWWDRDRLQLSESRVSFTPLLKCHQPCKAKLGIHYPWGGAAIIPPTLSMQLKKATKGMERRVWEAPPLYTLLQKDKAQRGWKSNVSLNPGVPCLGYLPLGG